ncbi:hypothetical protein NLJ89_g9868 [Agrocybe chaxingu]|uniref:Uncharacterized protein n=1 Tax=Agrocybe chaxingu TaxID=84603 RepID=A0A9W8MPG5_9AGAR|nr:hypothetical protein NLJ89_g9868 [Agrocybe chaxingu]
MSSPGLTPDSPFVVSPSASPQQPAVQQPLPVQLPLPVQQPPAPDLAHASVGTQTAPAPARTYASVGTQTRTVFLLSALSSPATSTAPAIVISDSDSSPSPMPPPQLRDLEEGSDDDMPASILLLQLPGLWNSRPEDPARPIPINPRVRAHPESPTTTSRKRRSDVDVDDTKANDGGSSAKRQCSATVLDSSDEAYSTFPSYPTHTPAFRPMDFMQASPNLFPTPGLAHPPNMEQAAAAYGDGADRPTPPSLSSPFISTRSRKTPARKNSHRGARSLKGKGKAAAVEPLTDDDLFAENLDPTNIKPSTGLDEEELFERLFKVKPATSTSRNQSYASRSRKMSKAPSTPFPLSGAPKALARNDTYSKASDFVPVSATPLLSLTFEELASNDLGLMLADVPESAVPSAPADDNFDDMYVTDPVPVASSEPPTLSSLATTDEEEDTFFADDDSFNDPTFIAALSTVMDEVERSASQPASQDVSAA